MATADTISSPGRKDATSPQLIRSRRIDWGVALLSLVFIAGAYWDGWAHNNVPNLIETFFTPYHMLLYGGFGLTATFVLGAWVQGLRTGQGWFTALPAGYNAALAGIAIFTFGGGFDLYWHERFGFEEDLEALISPSHLLLVSGGLLISTATIRAAWQRRTGRRLAGMTIFPVIISAFVTFSLITFITQYAHYSDSQLIIRRPFNGFDSYLYLVQSIFSFALPLWVLTGLLYVLLRRWQLPTGTITLIGLGNYGLMYWMKAGAALSPQTLGAAVVAALLGEFLLWWLRPAPDRPTQARLFGFLLPGLFTLVHILILLNTDEVWWRVHTWAGIPLVIAAGGLFLSYLFVPPPLPDTVS